MLDLLDPARLRVFHEVAVRGSFTGAAAQLRISQPAVSQHIAKLEQDTGVTLLDRSTRRLRLTGPGQVLLRHAQALLQQLESARRELADLGAVDSGQLRIATFPSGAATIVPALVGAFRRALPNVTVQLTEADPPVSLARLTNGDFDAVLAYDYPSMAVAKDPGLRWQVLAEDPMAVALPPGDALSSRDCLTMSDLAGRVFIAPYNCVCRDALADAARRAGFVLDIASETNDYLAMLGLVAAGVGVAILPRLITPFTLPGVTLLPLVDQRLRRSVAIVTRASGYAPQSLATFTELAASLTPSLACPQLPSQRATEPAR